MPQIAVTFPSLWYPPDLLLVLLPFNTGLAVSMVFHLVLAAAGMLFLLRSLQNPFTSAVSGAIVFSLSGYMFGLTSNHSLAAGCAWTVFSLWQLRRLEGQSGHKYWKTIGCCVSILMLMLSGRPEIIMPGLAVLIAYVGGSAFLRWKERPGRVVDDILAWQCRAIFLAFTFSLPALLPVAEWLSMSKRATGLQVEEIFLYSAHWYDVVSIFFGPSLGDLRLHQATFRNLVTFANSPPFLSCAYIGPIAATLAIWGAFDRSWRFRWLMLFLLAITMVASLGNSTPIAPLVVKALPLFAFVRFPIKLLCFSIICLAIFACRGMTSFATEHVSLKAATLFWTVVLACCAAMVWSGMSGHLIVNFANRTSFDLLWPTSISQDLALQAQISIGKSGIVTSLIALAIGALAGSVKANKLSESGCRIVILGLLAGSLLMHITKMERAGASSDYWQQPSACADQLKSIRAQEKTDPKSRVLNLAIERFTVPNLLLQGNQLQSEVAEYQYIRQLMKPNTNIDFSIPETLGFEGSAKGDYSVTGLHCYLESSQSSRPEIKIPSDIPLARFCALTSTSYTVTQIYRTIGKTVPTQMLDHRYFQVVFEDPRMNFRIYKNLNYVPRCYLSHNWRWANSHNEVLNDIVCGEANNFDPLVCTVLEPSSSSAVGPASAPGANMHPNDQLEVLQDAPECIKLKTTSTNSGYLILADQNYPGWEASLDSIPVPICVANAFTRAVYVPAGEHLVAFQYRPNSLKLGIFLFCMGLLLAGYLWFRKD